MISTATFSRLAIPALMATMTVECAAHRTSPPTDQVTIQEVEVITAGATAEFAPTACGRVITFSGRILSRSGDGTVRPVPKPQFWYEATVGGHRTQIDVEVDAQGSFGGTIWAKEPGFSFLTQGVEFHVETATSKLPVLVTANGCDDRHIYYDHEWESQDIYLDCHVGY